MKRRLSLLLFLLLAAGLPLAAQGYDAPEVVVSTEKANIAGKVYFLHKVLPKQTVFSICKAYGVTNEELAAANPDLKDGLKAGSILFVPVSDALAKAEEGRKPQEQVKEEESTQDRQEEEDETGGRTVKRVIEHRVRWYESIGSIARKYGLSAAEILSYNGLSDSDSIRGRTLLIPVMGGGDAGEEQGASALAEDPVSPTVTQTSGNPEDPMTPVRKVRWFSAREPLHLALILPFNATGGKASPSFLNFYSGALMAIQEQKEKGAHLVVNVYDLAQGADAILNDPKFEECELVIGPVEASTLDPFLRASDRNGTVLVSPLDHKADSLVNDHPYFFQVAPSTQVQLENLIGSVRRNHGPVVLASSHSGSEAAFVQQIEDLLQSAGLPYRKASLADLSSLAATGTHNAPAQVIIGSEDKTFATEAIRTLNTMRKKNIPLEVWCTNRVRNFETSDPEALFNIALHTSVPYFADYSNADDQDFVLRYRALFYAEPDDFAFQGHDVLTYFIAAMMQQGTAFT
ncbi:MAG: ABC transporter substrate-binding protein, partial [Bacteroidales bacterium]|nr:ABC transporter substrate-binding protein [Bacteroidales bacterium]